MQETGDFLPAPTIFLALQKIQHCFRNFSFLYSRTLNILAGGKPMDDLYKYIEERKKKRPYFAKNFEYKESAISRIENHAEDIRL
jgi:hypothetical protein